MENRHVVCLFFMQKDNAITEALVADLYKGYYFVSLSFVR